MKVSAKEINLAYITAKNIRKVNAVVCDSQTVIYNFFLTDGSVVSAMLIAGKKDLIVLD